MEASQEHKLLYDVTWHSQSHPVDQQTNHVLAQTLKSWTHWPNVHCDKGSQEQLLSSQSLHLFHMNYYTKLAQRIFSNSRMFSCNFANRILLLKNDIRDFPGGAVVKNLPANAEDMGSSPGLGRCHMLRSS